MHVPSTAIRPRLEIQAQAPVPTRFGVFQMSVFHWGGEAAARTALQTGLGPGLSPDHVALVMGEVAGKADVMVRVHSECITSEVFGSLKCDCREQLEAAQAAIARRGSGILLYLRQEGRGIGLTNKIRAYELQAVGHDTVDANRLLGLPDDARDYGAAAAMLDHLGVKSIRLITNNPAKVRALRQLGVNVTGRVSSVVRSSPLSADYLEAKRLRMGHLAPTSIDDEPPNSQNTSEIRGDAE
jgi:GTP cyclohydrolase II